MKTNTIPALPIVALLAWGSAGALAHTDVTPAQAHDMLSTVPGIVVLDVREVSEFCNNGHIAGAINMPWNSGVLGKRYAELDADAEILVVCQSGGRSQAAATFLDGKGYTHIYDMQGDMSAWQWENIGCSERQFTRGDANADRAFSVADPVFVLAYLFAGGAHPPCVDAANANGDATVDISDAVRMLDGLFGSRRPLPAPFSTCGYADGPGLGCASAPPPCE